ncbi:MAG: 3-hydroxyacyl-CoA dehydrogenase family protein [Burkholderiales bacterium]|nr:3-hydroxyacyl-CoA dehydrogenase family protein [Burkholderiales bacterium]
MKIAVAGAGLMGCGIAAKFAAAGYDLLVYDSAQPALENVHKRCDAVFGELLQGGALNEAQCHEASRRIRLARRVHELADVDIVVEAIVEVLEAKQSLFAQLEQHVAPNAIIASSTSGFTPEALARHMRKPERFLVAHFWNPPHLVPLVEVLGALRTAPATLTTTYDLLHAAGCEPVLLRKSVPGFIGNRIQFAVLREALYLLRVGVADAETIDRVMKQSVGKRYARIGPLEGTDAGGLDTFLVIATHLMPELSKDESALQLLRERVSRGERGRASGKGFYTWDEGRESWLREQRQLLLRDCQ